MSAVVVCLSATAFPVARKIADALACPLHGLRGRVDGADVGFDATMAHLRTEFAAGVPIIGVCASGILIRAVAPLLSDKHSEPPVLAVAEDGSAVLPLLGGHKGANKLALDVAKLLGAKAAITTAGDVLLGVSLEEPPMGYRLANPGDLKTATAAVLAGAGVGQVGERLFDLPDDPDGSVTLEVTEKPITGGPDHLVYHPIRLTLGLGCARNCPVEDMWALVERSLRNANIAPGGIAAVASIDLKGDEPAILAVAQRLGVPLRLFTAAELEKFASEIPNPSSVVFDEVGCHGVAEAAALAVGDHAPRLVVPKQKTKTATCAVGRQDTPVLTLSGRARGKLALVGIGPGQQSWRTPEASALVAAADELVGYGLYIDLLGALAAGKTRRDFPLGGEEDRCRYALEEAAKGRNIALICSGDAGIFAMGALVFELLDRGPDGGGVSRAAQRVEVVSAPGISALQGAAARAGAPLGHDFCAISLSDLLTPRDDIIARLEAAAKGDFVIAFYNPVSARRRTLLAEARDILLRHRPADTPVMLASELGRPGENLRYRTLAALEVDEVDMLTVVLVGSSHSRLAMLGEGPRMYTPRGYARRIDGDLA